MLKVVHIRAADTCLDDLDEDLVIVDLRDGTLVELDVFDAVEDKTGVVWVELKFT